MGDGGPARSEARGERLESWKAIATYLGRDVSTVQRWERREAMPVHRQPHAKQGSVYAYTGELDAWRAREAGESSSDRAGADEPKLQPASARRWRLAGAAAMAVVAGGALLLLSRRAPASPRAVVPAPLPFGTRFFAQATAEGGHAKTIYLDDSAKGGILLSRDGGELYAIDDNGVEVYDVASGSKLHRVKVGRRLWSGALSADGRMLLVGGDEASVYIIDPQSGRVDPPLRLPGVARSIVLSPDGRYAYAAVVDGGIERIDTRSLATRWYPLPRCPFFLAPAGDGRRLYIAFQCGGPGGRSGHDAIGELDTVSGRLVDAFSGPPMVGSALAVSPDGNYLWTSSGDACMAPEYDHHGCPSIPSAEIYVFDLKRRLLARSGSMPYTTDVRAAFLPGGSEAVLSYAPGLTQHVDALRGNVLESIAEGPATAQDGDGRRIAVGSERRVEIFDASAPACAPRKADLQHWWPGDGSADDAVGVANGALHGAAGYAAGRVGQAFSLSGGYVSFGREPDLDSALFEEEGFSGLAFWIKPDAEAKRAVAVASKAAADGARGWWLELDAGGRLQVCIGGGGCVAGGTRLPAGIWHHVDVLVGREPRDAELFIDGHRDVAAAVPDGRGAPEADFRLGAGPDGLGRFTGLIDEVFVTSAAAGDLAALPDCLAGGR